MQVVALQFNQSGPVDKDTCVGCLLLVVARRREANDGLHELGRITYGNLTERTGTRMKLNRLR